MQLSWTKLRTNLQRLRRYVYWSIAYLAGHKCAFNFYGKSRIYVHCMETAWRRWSIPLGNSLAMQAWPVWRLKIKSSVWRLFFWSGSQIWRGEISFFNQGKFGWEAKKEEWNVNKQEMLIQTRNGVLCYTSSSSVRTLVFNRKSTWLRSSMYKIPRK